MRFVHGRSNCLTPLAFFLSSAALLGLDNPRPVIQGISATSTLLGNQRGNEIGPSVTQPVSLNQARSVAAYGVKIAVDSKVKSPNSGSISGRASFKLKASIEDSAQLYSGLGQIALQLKVQEWGLVTTSAGISTPLGGAGGGTGGLQSLSVGDYGTATGTASIGPLSISSHSSSPSIPDNDNKQAAIGLQKVLTVLLKRNPATGSNFNGIFSLATSTLGAKGNVVIGTKPQVASSTAKSNHSSVVDSNYQIVSTGQLLTVAFDTPGYLGDRQFLVPRVQISDSVTGVVKEDEHIAGVEAGGTFFHASTLAPGTYNVHLKVDGFLRQVCSWLVFSGNSIPLSFSLLSGDVNNDNRIDCVDAAAVSSRLGRSWESDDWGSIDIGGVRTSVCDVNGDNLIDAADLSLVNSRLGLVGD